MDHDRKNEILETSGQNEFPLKGGPGGAGGCHWGDGCLGQTCCLCAPTMDKRQMIEMKDVASWHSISASSKLFVSVFIVNISPGMQRVCP